MSTASPTRQSEPSDSSQAGISSLFNSVLGSPFLLAEDPEETRPPSRPPSFSLDRPVSPAPTADYSFISRSVDYSSRWSFQPSPLRTILPRIWDVLSSPTRNILALSNSGLSSDLEFATSTPRKDKSRVFYNSNPSYDNYTDYSTLAPLDGEEGELIDDEACFIDIHAVTGFDILAQLPPELALHVLSYLFIPKETASHFVNPRDSFVCNQLGTSPDDALQTLFACLAVSRTWRRLASDNSVWKAAFLSRWPIDQSRVEAAGPSLPRYTRTTSVPLLESLSSTPKQSGSFRRVKKLALSRSNSFSSVRRSTSSPIPYRSSTPTPSSSPRKGLLTLDWRGLYQQRFELEQRWSNKFFEPKVMRIDGHSDSVYCLEFDEKASLIVTGSRDRTIKVWSLKSGRLLGTFSGAHQGSVLCLKFELEDEQLMEADQDPFYPHLTRGSRKGFMVSGSSDTTICVWDMEVVPASAGYERSPRTVKGAVRTTLRGHAGGVLDIRIDKKWIVSCSKDGAIRIWDRLTLQSLRTLIGHEGPVNAVGLHSPTGRVVSASGDGKMILWDIGTGARLHTFEGHDRGLACIEFKGDLIVSGSNDCKIKVWTVHGECLRTLVGHESLVRALSFDPSTGLLVSASYDRAIKVWDIWTGRMLREFKSSHSSHIFDVKFDCRRIVSTSHDQKLVVHDFSHNLDAATFFL